MRNIYDIRKEKNYIYIFSDEPKGVADIANEKIAVVINLYYEDTLELFAKYINCIPKIIDVFVFSSNKNVRDTIKKMLKREAVVLHKNNQGRDVSALLIGFQTYYEKYKYICFLHDKKEKNSRKREDTRSWINNLLSNMINSDNYIRSIIGMFLENQNIGLAIPPEPFGNYINAWYSDAWEGNFENTEKLVDRLNLKCDIDKSKSPLAISTAFWARTDAIRKMFEYEWSYDDFPEEPMPGDGTINHAIERIWGFLAQDAGYDVVTVMTQEYAKWELLTAQDASKIMFGLLQKEFGVHNLLEVSTYESRMGNIEDFIKKNNKVYLYGAGKYGRDLLKALKNRGFSPNGFCVSNLNCYDKDIVDGLCVYNFAEIIKEKNVGIIVSTDYTFYDEIVENMKKYDFNNYILAYYE